MPPYQRQMPVVDTDSHILEPESVWTRYLEPAHRERARTAFWRDASGPVVLNGQRAPALSHPNLPRYAIWRPGMTIQTIGALDPRVSHAVNPGASDPGARLRDMDALGIDQALLFPTFFLEYFPLTQDAEAAAALARAYNAWALDFAKAAPKRLFPVAVLPLQDVNPAIAEAKRAAAGGFKAVLVRPVIVNRRYPTHRDFLPLWRELADLGLVACVHPSPGPAAPEMDAAAPFIERVAANLDLGHRIAEVAAPTIDSAAFLLGLMTEGLLEKFPKLRVVFAHAGATWLPLALEKAGTYLWLSHQEDPVSLEPQRVFERGRHAVTFDTGEGSVRRMPEAFERVAAWGSRYPNHDTGTPANAARDLRAAGVVEPVIARLMGGNAAEVLGIS